MHNFTKSTLLAKGKIRHFIGMFLKNIGILSYYYPTICKIGTYVCFYKRL